MNKRLKLALAGFLLLAALWLVPLVACKRYACLAAFFSPPPTAKTAMKGDKLDYAVTSTAPDMSLLKYPQLLIAGVQKCGTSALYFGLCLHTNISCAAFVKEPFYLSLPVSVKHLQRYGSWLQPEVRMEYHRNYVTSVFNLSLIRPHTLTLEASTTYFESDAAFELIDKHLMNNREIKIVVMLRDPISRAYSQYQHDLRRHGFGPGRFDKDNPFHSKKFEELKVMKFCRRLDELKEEHGLLQSEAYEYASYYACIDRHREVLQNKNKKMPLGYLFKGLYYARIQKWMKAFGSRFKVVLYDDLRNDPLDTFKKLETFLGVPHFDYAYSLEALQHEYQEGSSGAIVRELAAEFSVHNELLGHLLGVALPWDDKLAKANFVIPT